MENGSLFPLIGFEEVMIAAYKLRRTEYILAHSSLVVIASNN
jgi:hypothetical protein